MTMSRQEMLDRLEQIARQESNHSAAIQAITKLMEIEQGAVPVENEVTKLFDASNPGRVRTKRAS